MVNLGPSLSELLKGGNSGRTTAAAVETAKTVQATGSRTAEYQKKVLDHLAFQSKTLAAIHDMLAAQQVQPDQPSS